MEDLSLKEWCYTTNVVHVALRSVDLSCRLKMCTVIHKDIRQEPTIFISIDRVII